MAKPSKPAARLAKALTSDNAKDRMEALQALLVESQVWAIETGQKLCVILEGRDTAGKDGALKRITEHASVRHTRVIALPKPSDREKSQWWFQRYAAHLPAAGEWVFFNRSWYNRAGVERVMGFSSPEEQETFLRDVPDFERMQVHSGVILIKYWLDITKDEQARRLEARRTDPLKTLKISPLDAEAQPRWADYSAARDIMLERTHHDEGHWTCVATDDKPLAREMLIRHLIQTIGCPTLSVPVPEPDPAILFPFRLDGSATDRLAP